MKTLPHRLLHPANVMNNVARHPMACRAMLATCTALMLGACTSTPLPPWPTTPIATAPAPRTTPPPLGTAPPVTEEVVSTTVPDATTSPVSEAPGIAESGTVSARFPEPPVRYDTPGLAPQRRSFTTNAELTQWLTTLAHARRGVTNTQLLDLGTSQQGHPIQALALSQDGKGAGTQQLGTNGRPTVVLVGQQHGDEPASSEALMVIARELAQGLLEPMLKRINVVIVARANPDGAAAGTSATANGTDLVHDHLLLRTPEAQALARLVRDVHPAVIIDAREYPATAPATTDALPRSDILLLRATAANVPEFITKAAQEWYLASMTKTLDDAGLTHDWYYTLQAGPDGLRAAMGDAKPDSLRNVGGLRGTVSLVAASRGIGLDRLHLQRRVHSLVLALTSALRTTVERADDLKQVRSFVARDTAAQACKGSLIVQAGATSSRREAQMIDPITGADRAVSMMWDSTLEPRTVVDRPRPCGYWLSADATDAQTRLRLLGLQLMRVAEPGSMLAETQRAIADGANSTVSRATLDAPEGSYYISMAQPLANVVAAALEPGTPFDYDAAGLLPHYGASARVMSAPSLVFDEVD